MAVPGATVPGFQNAIAAAGPPAVPAAAAVFRRRSALDDVIDFYDVTRRVRATSKRHLRLAETEWVARRHIIY